MFLRVLRRRLVLVPAILVLGTGSAAVALQGAPPEGDYVAAPSYDVPVPVLAPAAVQDVRPGQLILRSDPKSRLTPTGLDLWEVSRTASFDLPEAALRAYRHAAETMSSCSIPWWLLAGIGRVESNHGRFAGATLDDQGVSHPAIIGIALDGHGPVAAIRDTDDGRWDGDTVWDRAVGPMQFIPSTWAWAGRDGDGDGVASPNDLDDAALAAAGYLCRFGPLTTDEALRAAVLSYNHSDYYVDLVLAFGHGYETGFFEIPSPPALDAPAGGDVVTAAQPSGGSGGGSTAAHPTGTTTSGIGGSTAPSAAPSSSPPITPTPSSTPTATPAPEPSPPPSSAPAPNLQTVTGTWTTCTGGWCLDGALLDLGPDPQLDTLSVWDYDGNGIVDTNRVEFDGLAGRSVTVQVDTGTPVVYVIDDHAYRNADGSFTG